MTALPFKADILLRLGGVSSVPGAEFSRMARAVGRATRGLREEKAAAAKQAEVK
jgi:hypothetical protein